MYVTKDLLLFHSTTSTLSAGSTGSQARLIQSSHPPETYQPMQSEELGKQNIKTVKVEVHNAKARSPNRSPQRRNSLPKNGTITLNGGTFKKDLSPNHSRKSTPNHSRKSSPNRPNSRSTSKGSDGSPGNSRRSSPKTSRKSRMNSPSFHNTEAKIIKIKSPRETSPNVHIETDVKSPKRKSRDSSPKPPDNDTVVIKKKSTLRDSSPNLVGENGVKSPKRKSSLKKTSRSLSIDAPTCVECYLSGKTDIPG